MQEQDWPWWKTGIIYEVYLRSFQDSNGDGIGDLPGLISRLDYLQWLGVTAIWVTPFYPSPMKDFGYDISDYTSVHPLFGSMKDFEALVEGLHRRGMYLIIDFVPNHTSDQHPWFQQALQSKQSPYRDWYYWKNRPDGQPPNNWLGTLGGPAWEKDPKTDEYYYHAFLKEQPDLNLHHPPVMEAMLDIMRFWLGKGVDGFRVDVMWHLSKDPLWRDNPPNQDFKDDMPDCDRVLQVFSCDQPGAMKIVRQFRTLLDHYKNKVLLGELYLPNARIISYYGDDNSGAHLPGNFQLLFLPFESLALRTAIDQYEAHLPHGAWPNWSTSNHDRPRAATRYGNAYAKLAAMLLLTLRGTPTIYYGEELGFENVKIPDDEIQDPQGLLMPGKGLSRDPQRTPMLWDETEHGGFTGGKPWLRQGKGIEPVADQKNKPDSLLNWFRSLIELRQSNDALTKGDYYPCSAEAPLLAYLRQHKDERVLIVMNTSDKPAPLHLSLDGWLQQRVVLSILGKHQKTEDGMEIADGDGLIIILDAPHHPADEQ